MRRANQGAERKHPLTAGMGLLLAALCSALLLTACGGGGGNTAGSGGHEIKTTLYMNEE